jgi:hypothetical protein
MKAVAMAPFAEGQQSGDRHFRVRFELSQWLAAQFPSLVRGL